MRLVSPWARAGTITICSVSVLHAFQAVVLVAWPAAIGATPLLALRDVLTAVGVRDPVHAVGSLLIASAVQALAGAFWRLGKGRVWMLLLQHFLLGIMACGGIVAAVMGHYLDGTLIPWPHIVTDQAPLSALFIAHSFAILQRCWEPE